ncbi:Transcriptional regulator [Pseudomonas marginalis]
MSLKTQMTRCLMHLREQQRLSDSSWFLHRWDMAPEEFATYLLQLGTLVLQRRWNGSNRKTPTSTAI